MDMEEVKLVDRPAVRFLALCEANGIELLNCALYIREWIFRETTRTVGNTAPVIPISGQNV
jgi:hypothetical protein